MKYKKMLNLNIKIFKRFINNLNENKIKPSVCYDDIIKNLDKSEKFRVMVREKLKAPKEKSLDVTLDFKENKNNIESTKLDTLNKNYENIREISKNEVDINEQNNIIIEDISKQNTNMAEVKNSIWDFDFIELILNFWKNHSTLILMISGGLVIGLMLVRLGISFLNSDTTRRGNINKPK